MKYTVIEYKEDRGIDFVSFEPANPFLKWVFGGKQAFRPTHKILFKCVDDGMCVTVKEQLFLQAYMEIKHAIPTRY